MHNQKVVHKIEHVLLAPWSFLSFMALLFFNYTIMDLGDCMINIYPPYVSCLQKWVCFAHFNEENCSVRSSNNPLGSVRILYCPQLRKPPSRPPVKSSCTAFASPCFDTQRQFVSGSCSQNLPEGVPPSPHSPLHCVLSSPPSAQASPHYACPCFFIRMFPLS